MDIIQIGKRKSVGPQRSTPEPRAPSAQIPDPSREECGWFEWNPPRQLVRTIRDYQSALGRGTLHGRFKSKIAVMRHRFWSAVTGADIPLNTVLGGGFSIPHPNGVVIHPHVEIGPNCLLFQQVTLGTGPKPGVPSLGGSVEVAPGAKILGGVRIGDHARIGANAVVIEDVPAFAVAVGVPARNLRTRRADSKVGDR